MYMDTVRTIFCPCGLCARPQRNHIRRLIRRGLGRSVTELPIEEDGIVLCEDEGFTQTTMRSQKSRPVLRYQPISLTGGSMMDRRLVHQTPRRDHYSIR